MDHLSDLALDALRLHELDPTTADAARTHLETCEACAGRRRCLDDDALGFAARFDAASLAAETLMAPRARPPRRLSVWPRFAFAAMAAMAIVLVVPPLAPDPRPDAVRAKGSDRRLELFAVVGGDPAPFDGVIRAGASLRLRYDAGSRAYARIVWVDPAGATTALFPPADGRAIATRGAVEWVPFEIALDDMPGREAAHALFCDAPFAHEDALRWLEGPAPATCDTAHADVRKTAPP